MRDCRPADPERISRTVLLLGPALAPFASRPHCRVFEEDAGYFPPPFALDAPRAQAPGTSSPDDHHRSHALPHKPLISCSRFPICRKGGMLSQEML